MEISSVVCKLVPSLSGWLHLHRHGVHGREALEVLNDHLHRDALPEQRPRKARRAGRKHYMECQKTLFDTIII